MKNYYSVVVDKIKRVLNEVDRLEVELKNVNLNKVVGNAFLKLREVTADALQEASLAISGREKNHDDVKAIMKECLVLNRYGDLLNPFDLQEENFKPELFAKTLAREKRFWNQTDLSVAEHCVNLANTFKDNDELAKWAMIHEIYETYTGDLATPYKKCLPEYKIEENKALAFYAKKLGLSPNMPYEVHLADKKMMFTEALEYMPKPEYWNELAISMGEKEFGEPIIPFPNTVLNKAPLDVKEAEMLFARKWIELDLPITPELIAIARMDLLMDEAFEEHKKNENIYQGVTK